MANSNNIRASDVLLAGVSTDIRAHGITNVAEKIVFDGDGGKPKPPTSELDAVDEESDRVWRMMRTPMIRRDHLDPLVAEQE
jgi:hypothetical protein